VNLFAPPAGPADPQLVAAYAARLEGAGAPRWDDDGWAAKLEALGEQRVPVLSLTFGCPPLKPLRAVADEVWVTVTSPQEAAQAQAARADALIAQGLEAGGHRGSWSDREDVPLHGVLDLVREIRAGVPVVAAGGIATSGAVAAALAAGARAVQAGTAFMLAPEAGTTAAQREAFGWDRETALTRAFTGRLARGIRNRFMDEHSAAAPIAYPEIHHVTAPVRRAARERGDAEAFNLWAGTGYRQAEALPAAQIVRRLSPRGR
jgi:nitronate monooxygenase